MKNNRSKRLIYFSLIIVLSIAVIIGSIFLFSKPSQIEAQVASAMSDIVGKMNDENYMQGKFLENGMPLAMSSNPYDFIKDNEAFDKIIALGMEALPELVKIQNNNDMYGSLERYLIAIAIETISKTDLKAYEEFAWDQADAFARNWSKFEKEAAIAIPAIVNDGKLNNNEKLAKLAKYGMLSLQAMESDKNINQTSLFGDVKDKFEKSSRDELVQLAK